MEHETSKKFATAKTFSKINLILGTKLLISPHNGEMSILSLNLYFTPYKFKVILQTNSTISC